MNDLFTGGLALLQGQSGQVNTTFKDVHDQANQGIMQSEQQLGTSRASSAQMSSDEIAALESKMAEERLATADSSSSSIQDTETTLEVARTLAAQTINEYAA